jgi:uncharacterized protein (DUF4415 family)
MTNKRKAYTKKDLEEVLHNPKWTEKDIARAKPFAAMFPELAASYRRARGPQKSPTKAAVSLRLDRRIIDHFRATGEGWQTRINNVLLEVIGKR